ncbi:MAG: calcium/sodium antiporter [Pseudomonadota bacterium]
MLLPVAALVGGILLLILSADKFVEGAAATARRAGLPPLLIGMVVIGFGSSMPEMVISGLSAWDGNPGLAIGNALGSNISNIALILGLTAVISPIAVNSNVLKRELPMLAAITLIAAFLLIWDRRLDLMDGWILIGVFAAVMGWSIYAGMNTPGDELAVALDEQLSEPLSLSRALIYLVGGLVLLVLSSRIMVWGGVEIAHTLGISDLLIGLTVVAVGTSLPELASSIAAVRKNEHELALGNIIGSNMFNTSIVIGITGLIAPTVLEPGVVVRDFPVMIVLTLLLFVMGFWFRGPNTGRINRFEGALLLIGYVGYNIVLLITAITTSATA